jgi:hypothetical protein
MSAKRGWAGAGGFQPGLAVRAQNIGLLAFSPGAGRCAFRPPPPRPPSPGDLAAALGGGAGRGVGGRGDWGLGPGPGPNFELGAWGLGVGGGLGLALLAPFSFGAGELRTWNLGTWDLVLGPVSLMLGTTGARRHGHGRAPAPAPFISYTKTPFPRWAPCFLACGMPVCLLVLVLVRLTWITWATSWMAAGLWF